MMNDAFGIELKVGQEIAYAVAHRSRIYIERGTIEELRDGAIKVRKVNRWDSKVVCTTVHCLERVFVNPAAEAAV